MTRLELEQHIAKAIEKGHQYIYLTMNGDPSSARQRLLGHHWGPYGWCVGCRGNNNIVRFNALYVQEYLDELPIDKLSGGDDVFAEIYNP